jgi:hypothetical protein
VFLPAEGDEGRSLTFNGAADERSFWRPAASIGHGSIHSRDWPMGWTTEEKRQEQEIVFVQWVLWCCLSTGTHSAFISRIWSAKKTLKRLWGEPLGQPSRNYCCPNISQQSALHLDTSVPAAPSNVLARTEQL